MIKTVSLTANQETAVKIEGGSYCSIENRGTSVVYASKFPNVVASEDNVIAIDSSNAKILANATKLSDNGVMQGTIYLFTDSDGAVEVRTAMTTDPFKSKQKGGGEGSGGGVTDTYPQSVIDAKLAKKADEEVVNQALDNKVDKDGNKVLSDNNFSNDEKEKLANLVNYDDTQIKTDIINLQTSKANADDVYTIAQANSAIVTEVAKIVAEAPESLDTLKEISTWIAAHEDSASAMNLQIQTNKTNIAKKVDKKDGYSLVSNTEIARLANVHNYDDANIKAQNYTTSVKSATNTMCVFKFDNSINRFTAKFVMCGNNENRYADVFINVCFNKSKIKKYIIDNMTTIKVIKTEDNAINIIFEVEQYTTVTCVSTVPMTMITCYSASTLPIGIEIVPTEL
jgi:hypothetical protein